jgi:hypothetical protein
LAVESTQAEAVPPDIRDQLHLDAVRSYLDEDIRDEAQERDEELRAEALNLVREHG